MNYVNSNKKNLTELNLMGTSRCKSATAFVQKCKTVFINFNYCNFDHFYTIFLLYFYYYHLYKIMHLTFD